MDDLDTLLMPYDESLIPCPYVSAHPTGSRFTCTPAVITTDEDWLVLVVDLDDAQKELQRNGFGSCLGLSDPYRSEEGLWRFHAFRRGTVNLIVTDDKTMYLRSVAATLLCAKLNLWNKQDRIDLFRAIRFGSDYDGTDFEYSGPVP